tara:strand:+ start:162 stop:566 length:405 start_codon:yes stop_codon:yes gene_type:complete
MFHSVKHIAIAVQNIEEAKKIYANIFKLEVSELRELPKHGVKSVFVSLDNIKIELIEPLGSDSPLSNFLRKNTAGGIHHICFGTKDIDQSIAIIKDSGIRVLNDGIPEIGADGKKVIFLHPKDCNGTLIEIEQD